MPPVLDRQVRFCFLAYSFWNSKEFYRICLVDYAAAISLDFTIKFYLDDPAVFHGTSARR